MPCVSGTRLRQNFVCTDADGTAIDLSGYAIEVDIIKSDSRKKYFTLTESDGISVTDAANGTFLLTLSAARTEQIGAGMVRFIVRNVATDNDLFFEGSFPLESQGFDA